MLQTEFLKDISNPNDFIILEDKKFFLEKTEIRRDFRIQKFKYERKYFKDAPIIILSGKYSVKYDSKYALMLSMNKCLNGTYSGQITYNILFRNNIITIMPHHVDKILNGN